MPSLKERIDSLSPSQREALRARLLESHQHKGDASNLHLRAFLQTNSDNNFDTKSVAQSLSRSLPSYMLPQSYQILSQLPTNANGKIDRVALSELKGTRNTPNHTHATNTSSKDVDALCRLFEKVLSASKVSDSDDFFELGGDSILAIQLVSNARKVGFQFGVSDLFRNSTPSALAFLQEAEPSRTTPEVPPDPNPRKPDAIDDSRLFSPIQAWFFEQHFERPEHWNMSAILELDPSISVESCTHAITTLYERHDALRTRYHSEPTGLAMTCGEIPPSSFVLELRNPRNGRTNHDSTDITIAANTLHQSFRLESGILLRCILFTNTESQPAKLLMVAHHLAIDVLSWNVLVEEFVDSVSGNPLQIPSNHLERCRTLRKAATEPKILQSKEYWSAINRDRFATIPFDQNDISKNTEEFTQTQTLTFNKTQLSELKRLSSHIGISLPAICLGAIGLSLSKLFGSRQFLIGCESHGRSGVDALESFVSTVGWCTSYFPLPLDLSYGETLLDAAKEIQLTLDTTPQSGLSYGLLRYCHPDRMIRESLSKHGDFDVVFNFLGRATNSKNNSVSIKNHSVGRIRDPRNHRTSIFEISVLEDGEELNVHWTYASSLHRETTVSNLLKETRAQIKSGLNNEARESEVSSSGFLELSPNDSQTALLMHHLSTTLEKDMGQLLVSGQLQGISDRTTIQNAWDELVKRHPALRSRFSFEKETGPKLVVHPPYSQPINWNDQTNQPRESHPLVPPYLDLSKPPSEGPTINVKASDAVTFSWRCHHALLDGWSSSLLMEEWIALLQDAESLQDAVLAEEAFFNYYHRLKMRPSSPSMHFWQSELDGCGSLLIADQNNRALNDPKTNRELLETKMDLAVSKGLAAKASSLRVSPAALVIAAWGGALGLAAGQREVVFGLVQSGRNASIDGVERIAGNLSTLTPFRTTLPVKGLEPDWIREIMLKQEEASEHAFYSLGRIAEWTRHQTNFPLFDTSLTIANYPKARPGSQVQLRNFQGDTSSTLPLSLTVSVGGDIKIFCDYDPNQLSRKKVEGVVSNFSLLLTQLSSESLESTTYLDTPLKRDPKKPEVPEDTSLPVMQKLSNTEQKLIELLEGILSVDAIRADDSFFDLGGTSLQGTQFFAAIERIFGVSLRVSLLFTHPSIKQLAPLVERPANETKKSDNIVLIRKGDASLPPIFLIHAGGLQVLFYKDLADQLDPKIPVYGLEPLDTAALRNIPSSIEGIAASYLESVKNVYHSGPYYLIGHCMGVIIALEMAKQLKKSNKRVPLVVSVDGPALRYKALLGGDKIHPKKRRPPSKKARYFEYKRKLKFWYLSRFGNLRQQNWARGKLLKRAYNRALNRYKSEPYCGPVLHFKCNDSDYYPYHSDLYWLAGCPNVEIEHMNCSHSEPLSHPYVRDLARSVTRKINATYPVNVKSRVE